MASDQIDLLIQPDVILLRSVFVYDYHESIHIGRFLLLLGVGTELRLEIPSPRSVSLWVSPE